MIVVILIRLISNTWKFILIICCFMLMLSLLMRTIVSTLRWKFRYNQAWIYRTRIWRVIRVATIRNSIYWLVCSLLSLLLRLCRVTTLIITKHFDGTFHKRLNLSISYIIPVFETIEYIRKTGYVELLVIRMLIRFRITMITAIFVMVQYLKVV